MEGLVVVTGPPGAGKSTIAALLADRFDPSVLVSGDSFFAFLARGAVPPWLPESSRQNEIVTEAAAMAAGRYASGGYATIYDGVVGPWFLRAFARATGRPRLHYVVLLPAVEVCIRRVAERGGHGFTDAAATAKVHGAFVGAPLDERYVFLDPPDDPSEVVDLVMGRVASGALEVTADRPRA